jgi:hypothetical protein
MLETNKALILLAPRAGFEPATNRLTADQNPVLPRLIRLLPVYILAVFPC